MNISYDSKNDSLCLSKGQECTTIFNISEFWAEIVASKAHKQKFSYILQGKKVVEVRNNFFCGPEPHCDVYSGNKVEIKVVFYCNLLSIQMVFYMQEKRGVYLYWDDDSALQKLYNAKHHLKIHIKADQIAQILPSSDIAKDSLGHFMEHLAKFPKKAFCDLKAWDTRIAFDREAKTLDVSSGLQYLSLKQIEPEYFCLANKPIKDMYHQNNFEIVDQDIGYLKTVEPLDYGNEGLTNFNKNYLRIHYYKDMILICCYLFGYKKSYRTSSVNPSDDNFDIEPYISERRVEFYLDIQEFEKTFLIGLSDEMIEKFRKQINCLADFHLEKPDKKIMLGKELARVI